MYIFSIRGIIASWLGASSSMEPSITKENTLEVEGKLLEIEMVSLDLSTTTLNSLGVSLMPSKWKHSISHKVESLISLLFSLKWAKWLSYSHGIGTTSSLKHMGIGSVLSTPCASFGEGKVPCSPFLTLSSPSCTLACVVLLTYSSNLAK